VNVELLSTELERRGMAYLTNQNLIYSSLLNTDTAHILSTKMAIDWSDCAQKLLKSGSPLLYPLIENMALINEHPIKKYSEGQLKGFVITDTMYCK
jgi:hypothetical protein